MKRLLATMLAVTLGASLVGCGGNSTSGGGSTGPHTVKVAGSDEFFNNADAMPAFEDTYGFSLKPTQ